MNARACCTCALALSSCAPFSTLASIGAAQRVDLKSGDAAPRVELGGAVVPAGSRGLILAVDADADPKQPIRRSEVRGDVGAGYAVLPVAYGSALGGEALVHAGSGRIEVARDVNRAAFIAGLRLGLPVRIAPRSAPWAADADQAPMWILELYADPSAVRAIADPAPWRFELSVGLELRVDFWSREAP